MLYHEYVGYAERVQRYTKESPMNVENVSAMNYTNEDINTLDSFMVMRNTLLGCETFLKESVANYNPSDFSYANTLKEKFITQLESIKFTQPYWDKILTSFYTDRHSEKSNALTAYDAIMRVPTTYVDDDIDGEDNIEIIEAISTEEYWKRQLFQFDRSAQSIENIWTKNKAFFYTFMSKSKYDNHCKIVVTDLIEIHTKITEEPNYKEFYKTHNVNDSIFHTFPTTQYVNTFEYSWPFSFWDRRFEENNDEIVFKILKEINNHYQN